MLYDIQFLLYTHPHPVKTEQDYLEAYEDIIAFGDGELTTGGYAPDFIKDWFAKRKADGDIVPTSAGNLAFSKSFLKALPARLREFQ